MAPDITIFLNSLFNFISVFEVLMLRLQTHSNYHIYFEYPQRMLYAYSNLLHAHSKYSGSNISMDPIKLAISRRGESHRLIPSLAPFLVAPATSRRCQVLLYAHSKYGGASVFYHLALRVTQPAFIT